MTCGHKTSDQESFQLLFEWIKLHHVHTWKNEEKKIKFISSMLLFSPFILLDGMQNDLMNIFDFPMVIKAAVAVHFTTTGTTIPGQYIPMLIEKELCPIRIQILSIKSTSL